MSEAMYNRNRSELFDEMKEDFGYHYCQNCSRSSGFFKLECHHIVYRSEAPEHPMLHHKKNLIIVCTDCHERFHDSKVRRNGLVTKRRLNELFGRNLIIDEK